MFLLFVSRLHENGEAAHLQTDNTDVTSITVGYEAAADAAVLRGKEDVPQTHPADADEKLGARATM